MLLCPECDTQIHLAEEIRVSRVVFCTDCRMPWEIINRIVESITRPETVQFGLVKLDSVPWSECVEGDWGD